MPRPWSIIIFAASGFFAIMAGRWALGLATTSEYVHFSVNFPAPSRDVLGRVELGGPWTSIPDPEWTGYPAGGLLPWGREGAITVDLGQQGFLKKLVQPGDVTISTHWLRNVGRRPIRVRLELDACGLPVEWETFESSFDYKTHEFTRAIVPGRTATMDWHLQVQPPRRDQRMICDGGLKVMDADVGELLTFLPIRLINSAEAKPGRAEHD
ncbi:MAG TPA: hypothetical protein VM658_08560 [bacterium]|nr:hypothetical protein [bacterium]